MICTHCTSYSSFSFRFRQSSSLFVTFSAGPFSFSRFTSASWANCSSSMRAVYHFSLADPTSGMNRNQSTSTTPTANTVVGTSRYFRHRPSRSAGSSSSSSSSGSSRRGGLLAGACPSVSTVLSSSGSGRAVSPSTSSAFGGAGGFFDLGGGAGLPLSAASCRRKPSASMTSAALHRVQTILRPTSAAVTAYTV